MSNNKMIELRNNKTIKEITDELELNPNMYEAYENGTRTPKDIVKTRIANYFGAKVTDIWQKV